jgi:hypothetical protein
MILRSGKKLMAKGAPINRPVLTDDNVEPDWDASTHRQIPSAPAEEKGTETPGSSSTSATEESRWLQYFSSPNTRPSPAASSVREEISMASISDIGFKLKPFSRTARDDEKADRWLHAFNTYNNFKKIEGNAKLNLFKLMMADQFTSRDVCNAQF